MTRPAVDWDLARRRAASLVRPGPKVDRRQAAELVDSIRAAAHRSPELVGEVTGLTEAAERAGRGPVYVIDRPRWAEGNLQMFRHLLGDTLPEPKVPGGARVAGEELGAVLSLLASRVLGQFDPFTPNPGGAGRLVVVAPNVLHVQRELALDAGDFHLWVCLHEQTHALQFAAAPWLAEHLQTSMTELMTTLMREKDAGDRMRGLLEVLPRILRGSDGPASASSGAALLGAVLTEEEQEVMGRSVAVMSLLEGHADVVMDDVGPKVVPTVRRIRAAFEVRRAGHGLFDTVLRRLLGMDSKLAQYREGASFVRGVTERCGHEGLNAVWAEPANLPSGEEIADPGAWVRRVHG